MKNKNLRVRANAKVNLALHIVGEHPSGLHFLDSLVAFPAFGDELIFERERIIS
jgi:4-diphosphocytidyl-2-C-methyl-D-erythritol kinase